MKRKILECPNYISFRKPASIFDPDGFDMDFTRRTLTEALNSTNSVPTGAKKYTTPFHDDADHGMYRAPEKGKKVVKHFQSNGDGGLSRGFWEEVQSEKDRRSAGVCAACGKPGGADLKRCGGCRQIL